MRIATGTGEIVCGAHKKRKIRCPKNSKGHAFRGVKKCLGCTHATWIGSGLPYGR